ncbi:hypothetical protein G7Y89_g14328 [Cudoniella acicularis]|uniref:Uncharacterized protein n=1 Tax=Cudoniella acicularis TaxID=354080 RepID=A0A8H4R3Q0_9HELO|nr:hypothetical protein G7Y89_g14328 [Cudoniella acicularis]
MDVNTDRIARIFVRFRGDLLALIPIDSSGLMSGFSLKMTKADSSTKFVTWTPPTYAKPDSFTEKEIFLTASDSDLFFLTIKDLKVKATLTTPKGGSIAGVVFIPGSGPLDRDGTIGPNKPLKDLAWGLASERIAFCRWEKMSYLPLTLPAIQQIYQRLRLKENDTEIPIILIGYSLGGIVAPRIAAASTHVKGLILLGAGSRKLYDSILKQVEYLAAQNSNQPFATREHADLLDRQINIIHSPSFNEETSADQLPFGLPASHWLDIKRYDQVAAAAKLGIPMAVMHAGWAYQTAFHDDFRIF